jgi:hypothetical protein
MRIIGLGVILALVTGAPALAGAGAKAPAQRQAGARSCISIPHIDHTEILDDSTILFHMKGGKIWKNSLPHKCFSLKFEDGFSYATSLSELCNTDIIHVIRQGTTCGLGDFVPYDAKAEKAKNDKANRDDKAKEKK